MRSQREKRLHDRDRAVRWPTFVAHALAAGFESILAFRLFAAEDTLGALNL